MSGYLIGEEGLLAGVTIPFEEGVAEEWIIGRDPAFCQIVLEDPMVSRRHLLARLTPEGIIIENLSTINPAMQNGRSISEPVLLKDGDHIEIGSTLFRYEQKKEEPQLATEPESIEEESAANAPEEPSEISFAHNSDTRWLLKVISGPNAGAEFGMKKSSSYVLGKDPNVCNIFFQDLSVSREHALLTVDENYHVFIEDLSSKNGVIVNGELISGKREIFSQDLVSLGTTSFLVIDREQAPETIISPPITASIPEQLTAKVKEEHPKPVKAPLPHWRDLIIPKRHLILAGMFAILILGCVAGMFSLFRTEPIVVKEKNESQEIQKAIAKYDPAVQFSFNQSTGKLFLVGHVLTSVDKQELIYTLQQLPYITNIEDNVVIDEYVWESTNSLLMTNPTWVGVSLTSSSPGKFVLRGYLQTLDQAQALTDYINLNFPYLDRLENQVVVESNLQAQLQTALIEKGYANVTFQLSNGEVVFAGRADEKQSREFNHLINEFKAVPGIRMTKNYVIFTSGESTRIDLSGQYQVTGYSKRDSEALYVVINGRILSLGDTLDGMMITSLQPNTVMLEKDGLKYRINYNLQ